MVYIIQWSSSHWRQAIWHLQDLDARTTCQVLQHKWLHPRIHHQMNNNINNHCLRSNQGEGHPIDSLQGIWGHAFWENPHQITTLSIIRPHYWTQGLVYASTSEDLPTQSHQTSSLQRVCWKTSQDKENLPFKISPGCTNLFHQKEGSWEIMPLPRLPVSQ